MQSEFMLLRPKTFSEALRMTADHASDSKPLAGGTNVVVELRNGKYRGKTLIDLSRLAELRGIKRQNGHVVIGGGTTLTDLLMHPLIAAHASPLREAAAVFGSPLVRNRATVAGNLVDASPAADTVPPLLALGAEVELAGQGDSRWVPLEDFMVHVRKTLLQPGELMRSIRWSVPSAGSRGAYYKLGLRKADAISVLSVAVMLDRDEKGGCAQARIALGAVAPRPLRVHQAENVLRGQTLSPHVIAESAHLAAEATSPITDIRGTAAYRKRVTEVIVRRLLTSIADSWEAAA